MKRVWILNHYALAPSSPGGTRHYSLAANLRRHGWDATVIAASVEHNSHRQRLAVDEPRRYEVLDGVPFLWLRTPIYTGNGLARIYNMLAYTTRALAPATARMLPAPDVVIGSSVHPFAALAGALLARRYQVPFVFEVRDLWPQTLIDLGRLNERSAMTAVLRGLERALYQAAARIITLLPNAGEYIGALGVDPAKIVWIPNGVELSAYRTAPGMRRKADDPFVLMYFGAHGTANGLDHVLRAASLATSRLPPGALKLRLVGDGPLKGELMRLAQSLGMDNVTFEPPVPKCDIPALAAQADAFVLSVLDRPQLYRYGISMNKLFDYLAAGRPILMASEACNNPVKDAGAGITVPPANPEAMAAAMTEMALMPPEQCASMGRSGRDYVAVHHSFEYLAERLAGTLDACAQPRTAVPVQHHSAPPGPGSKLR